MHRVGFGDLRGGDDLKKLEEALHLGCMARRISGQNIVFALIVLAVLIPLGLSGATSVVFIVLVHEASELLAVANGLRVGRLPRKEDYGAHAQAPSAAS